jgi:hypothetical protein
MRKGYQKPTHLPFYDDENFPPMSDIATMGKLISA